MNNSRPDWICDLYCVNNRLENLRSVSPGDLINGGCSDVYHSFATIHFFKYSNDDLKISQKNP